MTQRMPTHLPLDEGSLWLLPERVVPILTDAVAFPLIVMGLKEARDAELLVKSAKPSLLAETMTPTMASQVYRGLQDARVALTRSMAILEAADASPIVSTGLTVEDAVAVGQERGLILLHLVASIERGKADTLSAIQLIEELAAQREWTLRTT